jgi:hypothetical protein
MARITFTAGQVLAAADVNEYLVNEGYQLVQTIYSTSSGDFTKATYPWLRAIRVRCQGAGGGGGGAQATGSNQVAIGNGGSGGAYAESFVTDIAGLAASITTTVGAGGAGGAAGANNGSNGGNSSFGSLVIAGGGLGGAAGGAGGVTGFPQALSRGGIIGTGEILIPGGPTFSAVQTRADFIFAQPAGGSVLGSSSVNGNGAQDGVVGLGLGAGGTGGQNTQSLSGKAGGNGSQGIVILELFA